MKNKCFLSAAFAFITYLAFSQSGFNNANSLKPGKNPDINCQNDCPDSAFPSDWRFIGPGNPEKQNSGKVHALWVDPADQNHILAGAESGLWETTDGGQNWTCITDYCLDGTGVSCIAVQPDAPDVIYIGTGVANDVKSTEHNYGYGIYKSTDGGLNWRDLHVDPSLKPEQNYCSKIIVHPVYYSNIYSIIGSHVYKSVDYGENWAQIFGDKENPDRMILKDIKINPQVTASDEVYISCKTHVADWNSNDTIFAPWTYYRSGTIKFPTAKVWKFESKINTASVSEGTLEDMCDGIPGYASDTRIAMLSFTPTSLNIACQTESGRILIFRKSREGVWTSTSPGSTRGYNSVFSFPFAVSPVNDDIMYLGGNVLNKSSDGGKKFAPLWSYAAWLTNSKYAGSHADIRDLLLYQADSTGNDILFLGTDGGIGKTSDGGKSTVNLNGQNLQLTQFFGISNSERFPYLIYGGSQDNGVFNNSGINWKCDVTGDAYDAVSDLYDSLVAYTTSGGSVIKTSSGGGNWASQGCPPGENCMDRPLWVDNQNRLYLGAKNLWRHDGKVWTKITDIATDKSIRSFKMTKDGNTAYLVYSGELYDSENPACSFKGRVFKVTNINTQPEVTDITACLEGVRWASITGVAIEPVTGERIWVCFGGFWESKYKVFEFENNTWTEYGQGLPNIPSNTIEFMENSGDLLFIGMDDGVYYRARGMTGWEKFSCNLPHTIVADLKINYSLNRLRAATYGRGIWESPIPVLKKKNRHQ